MKRIILIEEDELKDALSRVYWCFAHHLLENGLKGHLNQENFNWQKMVEKSLEEFMMETSNE